MKKATPFVYLLVGALTGYLFYRYYNNSKNASNSNGAIQKKVQETIDGKEQPVVMLQEAEKPIFPPEIKKRFAENTNAIKPFLVVEKVIVQPEKRVTLDDFVSESKQVDAFRYNLNAI
jgi:hypothetical protein